MDIYKYFTNNPNDLNILKEFYISNYSNDIEKFQTNFFRFKISTDFTTKSEKFKHKVGTKYIDIYADSSVTTSLAMPNAEVKAFLVEFIRNKIIEGILS